MIDSLQEQVKQRQGQAAEADGGHGAASRTSLARCWRRRMTLLALLLLVLLQLLLSPPHVMEEVTRSAGSRGELSLESLRCNSEELQAQLRTTAGPSGPDAVAQGPPEVATPPSNDIISGSAPQSPPTISPDGAGSPGAPGALGTLAVLAGGKPGFVSSEQLQEILQDLCVDAVSASLSYLYPSISPYVMRKRRPPFHASRAGPPSYCYPSGSAPLTRRGVAPHGVDPETEPLAAVDSAPSCGRREKSAPLRKRGAERHAENVPLRWARRGSRWDERGPPRRCTTSAFPRSHPKPAETEGPPGETGAPVTRTPIVIRTRTPAAQRTATASTTGPTATSVSRGPNESTESNRL
ncbi:hypothetical protein SKAU_G00242930 [Synaphobranchus kaupii]|uniref:Transmembrane protein n=1 Tax=Synaphobranchus kaupii TaxID=118154 RepID=A0A9Q1F7T4_SYNKA|nr:hypothetical protein SKAU_G00242930 [Synaphobranchus kaupii]